MSRLANSTYTERPWRMHEVAADFTVEDMWSFRTPGAGPDDFPTMLAAMLAAGGFDRVSMPVRLLFAVRFKLGALLGWDKPTAGLGKRVASLRDRLPSDLRDAPRGADSLAPPLTPVYQLDREAVREIANRTVHSLMHLTWVQNTSSGGYELQMAILVKANGRARPALHGRYRSVPLPHRLPGRDPALGTRLAGPWPPGARLAACPDALDSIHDTKVKSPLSAAAPRLALPRGAGGLASRGLRFRR